LRFSLHLRPSVFLLSIVFILISSASG
jgi:hypothetical protein